MQVNKKSLNLLIKNCEKWQNLPRKNLNTIVRLTLEKALNGLHILEWFYRKSFVYFIATAIPHPKLHTRNQLR